VPHASPATPLIRRPRNGIDASARRSPEAVSEALSDNAKPHWVELDTEGRFSLDLSQGRQTRPSALTESTTEIGGGKLITAL
jgi:hypothetical protein